jgi:hypothetical protein
VNEVRSAILALPIWPDNVKRQLEGIKDWQNTLIVPNVDGSANEVTVAGNSGVLVDNGTSPALLWQDGSVICALTSYSQGVSGDMLINTAEALR